jgi:PASTA domain
MIAVSLALAAPAYANTASISFTDAAGNSDPVAGVGRTFTVSGNTSAQEQVYVEWRAAGGAPCAPSASSDAGSPYFNDFSGDQFNGTSVNGNFKLVKTGVWGTPGTFLFCIWLAPSDSAAVTPISQTVTFREPTGTISASLTPASPSPGQPATVTIIGSSEAPEQVYATVRPAGGSSCSPSYSADTGTSLVDGYSVNGSFSTQTTVTENTPGTYLICLWLADSSSGTAIAGPQPETFTVPGPPCLEPNLVGNSLTRAEQRLQSGHCTVGAVTHAYSTTVASGRVLSTVPGPGHYANGQSIAIVLSAGAPPCVAPSLRGLTVRQAVSRLRQANCSLGAVRRPRHRSRRPLHVRRQSVPAGSRHVYRYPIDIALG